jgi:epoxyqueuosine reductase
MGNRIYGCDDCLAVCPWNKFAKASSEMALAPRAELQLPLLIELAQLDDAAFRQRFAGTPVKRLGRDRFLRNVAIALGNSGDAVAVPAIERLVGDASPLVQEAAQWARDQFANAAP